MWGIPIGSLPLSFEGYANFIAAKGKDEFGNDTKPETNIDMQVMVDLSGAVGWPQVYRLSSTVDDFLRPAPTTVSSRGNEEYRTELVKVDCP